MKTGSAARWRWCCAMASRSTRRRWAGRDKEANRRMTTDTIFRIASQTKAITSVGVLALVEEGKIGINDPVSRFIPAYAKTTVAVPARTAGRPSCPPRADHHSRSADPHGRHLLRHRAPMSRRSTRRRASDRPPASAGTPRTRASRSATRWSGSRRCRSSASPAKRWVYGYNTDILGCVVEKRVRACRSTSSSGRGSPARSA